MKTSSRIRRNMKADLEMKSALVLATDALRNVTHRANSSDEPLLVVSELKTVLLELRRATASWREQAGVVD